jgi:integrase/recombinase XerD
MLFSKAIEGFLLHMQVGNYSQNTVNIYGCHLKQMLEYIGDMELRQVTAQKVEKFYAWYAHDHIPHTFKPSEKKQIAPSTLYNLWCTLRTFEKWARTMGSHNLTGAIKRPKKVSPQTQPFTEAELIALLKAAEKTTVHSSDGRRYDLRRYTHRRDVAMILILLDTGIRVGELCRLKVSEYNAAAGELSISPYGTGRKTHGRVVFLGKRSREALWTYLAKREDVRTDEPLFLNREGRPVVEHTVQDMLQKLGKCTGIKCHPHRFRHTAAIQFLRNGGDVFSLQRMLGHNSLDMVKRYVALVDSDLQNVHRKVSPADRWQL